MVPKFSTSTSAMAACNSNTAPNKKSLSHIISRFDIMVRIQDEIDPEFRATSPLTTAITATATATATATDENTIDQGRGRMFRRYSNPTTFAHDLVPSKQAVAARRSSLAHVAVPRQMRRSSIGGPLPEPSAANEEATYDNSEFRDFQKRIKASKRVTTVGIHQALHTDEDPLQVLKDAKKEEEQTIPLSEERMKRRNSLQGRVQRVLSTIQTVGFSEEGRKSTPSLRSDSGENDVKNRYMSAMSMNLRNESWD